MGNGCFILNVNKICSKNTTNEAAEILENVEIKEEKKSQSNNDLTNIVYIIKISFINYQPTRNCLISIVLPNIIINQKRIELNNLNENH